MVDQSLASRLEKDFKRIRCEPTFVPIPSRSIDHTNQHRDHVTRPVQLTQAPPLPLLDNRIEISAPNRSGVVESSLAARGFPGLSRLNVDDFSLFQGVPGEMKGKRKREGMRERSIGRVVKTEAVRSQGEGGKEFCRPGVTFHWSACPVSNPFCSALRFPPRLLAGIN